MKRCALIAVVVLIWPGVLAEDWPQYRGPRHDGSSAETLRLNWNEELPRVVWKKPMSPALSSFAVSEGRLFTQGRRLHEGDQTEFCIALDAETGDELWATPLGMARYPNGGVGSDDGPRSTSSVDGGRVYVLTSYLRLYCLQAENGEEVWSKELIPQAIDEIIPWQNAASPLVWGDLVLVNGNNYTSTNFIACNKNDGSIVWTGPADRMTHATPVPATFGGVEQVVFFTQSGLAGLAPETGLSTRFHQKAPPFPPFNST